MENAEIVAVRERSALMKNANANRKPVPNSANPVASSMMDVERKLTVGLVQKDKLVMTAFADARLKRVQN